MAALLRERLPAPLVALLSDEPPELVDGVFVDDALKESRSDRLYRLKLKGAGALFVYCLVEHKSAAEERAGVQLLGYMVRQWERAEGGVSEPLAPILPLVIYHGPTPSKASRYFSGLEAPHAAKLGVKPLDFEMVLVDLGAIDDDELSSEPTPRAGLLALKYATREALQRARLGKVLTALASAPGILRVALVYMMETYRGVNRAQLLGEARRVMPEEDVMTVAQELRDEGRVEGEAKGEAKGRVEGQRSTLLRVLGRRFGSVPDDVRGRVIVAASAELEGWLDLALDAATLDAVFGPATH